ncbi:hypothetical protein ACR6C2_17020 [Streptomyces sp. INA 01156]
MKMRRGWIVVWSDGTEWWGDCPKWAESARKYGHKALPMRIMGRPSWNCDCAPHSH